jgi:hypothetical protein
MLGKIKVALTNTAFVTKRLKIFHCASTTFGPSLYVINM